MKIPAPDRRIQILKKKIIQTKKSVKKIKSVASELSVSYFERVRTEPKAKEQSTNS